MGNISEEDHHSHQCGCGHSHETAPEKPEKMPEETLLLYGGVLFAALFCATDPVTTPVTRGGRVLFALLVGVLTALLRRFAPDGEGVMWAILAANLLTPLLDKLPRPGLLGGRRHRHD